MKRKRYKRHKKHKARRKKSKKSLDFQTILILMVIGIILGLLFKDSSGIPLISRPVLYDAETMMPLDKVQYGSVGNNSVYGIPVYFYDLNQTEADFALELVRKIDYKYLKGIKSISFVNRRIYNSEVEGTIDGLYSHGVITISTKDNGKYRITTSLCHEVTHHHLNVPQISVGHELVGQLGESMYCYNGFEDYKYEAHYIEAQWIPEYSGTRPVIGYSAVRDLIEDDADRTH